MPPGPLSTSWPIPKLTYRIAEGDTKHPGVEVFLIAIKPEEALRKAVIAYFEALHTLETVPNHIEEITLVLESIPGVAYLSGMAPSSPKQRIHYSLQYVQQTADRAADEIVGVLVFEMFHIYNRITNATCPGGFIDGLADYVRLKSGYAPSHWVKQPGDGWEAGNESTAYFLDWIEKRPNGKGTVHKLHEYALQLNDQEFNENIFDTLTGETVDMLWGQYCDSANGTNNNTAIGDLSQWPIPKLNLRIEDLDHEGADIFLGAVKPKVALREAVMATFNQLYTLKNVPRNVKTITLVLRSMGGVAHTTGGVSHKEIHYSLEYVKEKADIACNEIMGVLVHEVVHCYQHTARGTCPGGLIEGIADYVRLRDGRAPAHWRQSSNGCWDAGYDTTGYFLDWIESTHESGTIPKLNARMKSCKYNEEALFKEVTCKSVDDLWSQYSDFLRAKGEPMSVGK
ncbi:hypothetical protein NLJ89_g8606 [Agrocybe chaxingu]|uniref:Uncharacterized protein n=1 Tax=Agrocybe chaxingu TaxID=84603 RepID=A0A9W8MQM1_9AGAR|nr:hypothetical protein NLJ89_g8606 [Agrocybe chaxingu]